MEGFSIEVDASATKELISTMAANMTQRQFEHAMYGIFRKTGRHAAAILRKDLPQKYEIGANEVSAAVRNPQLGPGGFGGIGCTIPIVDSRRFIGQRFKASGGAHGWNSVRRKYRVKARILKGAQSTLPAKWHTGFPPFRNLSMGSKNAYARTSHERGPLMKLTGIAIPQMPMNRSRADVERDLAEYLEKAVEDRFRWFVLNG